MTVFDSISDITAAIQTLPPLQSAAHEKLRDVLAGSWQPIFRSGGPIYIAWVPIWMMAEDIAAQPGPEIECGSDEQMGKGMRFLLKHPAQEGTIDVSTFATVEALRKYLDETGLAVRRE